MVPFFLVLVSGIFLKNLTYEAVESMAIFLIFVDRVTHEDALSKSHALVR